MTKNEPPEHNEKGVLLLLGRIALAGFIILSAIAYTALIVLGVVPETRRIDTVNLAIILLAIAGTILLLRPQAFTLVKVFQWGKFRLELREVIQRQEKQESHLTDIDLILPILLPKRDREYLLNLAAGNDKTYLGNLALRRDLRRLCSVRLIKRLPDKHVGELKEGDFKYDLKKYVELTQLGWNWVRKLIEIEKAKEAEENPDVGTVVKDR